MSGKILKRDDLSNKLDLTRQVDLQETASALPSQEERRIIRKDEHQISKEAQSILDQALSEAENIKKRARTILEKVEAQAAKAREDGWKAGHEEGLASVSELLIKAKHSQEALNDHLEKNIVRLIFDVAEKVIGRDLEERRESIVGLIRQALQIATGQNIIVLVHPQDLEVVKNHHAQLVAALEASRTLQVRSSEKVALHGCLIETEIGTIDAQLETQLVALKKALGIEDTPVEGG